MSEDCDACPAKGDEQCYAGCMCYDCQQADYLADRAEYEKWRDYYWSQME